MASQAWKAWERRACRMFGGERAGPLGRHGSDGDSTCLVSLECKRQTKYQLRAEHLEQARRQGKAEGRPWVLALSQHGDRQPIAVVDLHWLAQLVSAADGAQNRPP